MCSVQVVFVQAAVMAELENFCVEHVRTNSGLTEFEDITHSGNVTLIDLSYNQIKVMTQSRRY